MVKLIFLSLIFLPVTIIADDPGVVDVEVIESRMVSESPYEQARILIVQQRYEEAFKQLALVPAVQRDLNFYLMAGQTTLALQQYENAIEAFQLARGLQPDDLNIMFQLARTYRLAGRIELCTSLVETIISQDQTHRQALILYGGLKTEQGNWEASRRIYQELVNQDSTNVTFHYNLANALNMLRETGLALVHLRQAHRFSPNHQGVLHDLIKINYGLGFYDISREYAEKAMQIQPNYIPFRKRFAELEFGVKDYLAAAVHYKAIIELGENTQAAWRNYALSIYLSENYTEAVTAFRKSLSFGDGDPNIHFYLAMSLHKLGHSREVIQQLDISIYKSMGTLLLDGFIQKGSIQDQLGEIDGAYESYMMAYRLEPLRTETLFYLAAAYDRTGNHRTEARDYYRQFLQTEGTKDDKMVSYARTRISRLTEEIHFRGQ